MSERALFGANTRRAIRWLLFADLNPLACVWFFVSIGILAVAPAPDI